jgi:hypothetical protein
MKKLVFIIGLSLCAVVCISFVPVPQTNGKMENCTFVTSNGKKIVLYGKVQVVNSFPDIKVQVVNSFPDIKVQRVTSFPNACGKWQYVESNPDIKVQFVDAFPDIKVQFVESFPGIP